VNGKAIVVNTPLVSTHNEVVLGYKKKVYSKDRKKEKERGA
jgi:hypothetical protein